MDRGAWKAAVHGVTEGQTWLNDRLLFHFSLSCTGGGNGHPLQCCCLENPRDGGAWRAVVYGVAQSRTRLKWLSSMTFSSRVHLVVKSDIATQLYSGLLNTQGKKNSGLNRLFESFHWAKLCTGFVSMWSILLVRWQAHFIGKASSLLGVTCY